MNPDKQNFLDDIRQNAQLHIVDFMKLRERATNIKEICFPKTWYKFDADRSGRLEKGEIRNFLASLLEKSGKIDRLEKDLECLIKYFDINRDGMIELNEFALIIPVENNFLDKFKHENLSEDEFNKIFEHYDKDNNGSIEKEEISALMVDLRRTDMEDDSELDIQTMGLDEFKDLILRTCDENKDGKISKSDLKLLLIG